jgi:hypothetical protein
LSFLLVILALSGAAPAPAPAPEDPPGRSSFAVKGADMDLLREVRALSERVDALRGRELKPPPLAVRAAADTRRLVADVRARSLLAADRLEARGRAWADIGLGDASMMRSLWTRTSADLRDIACDPSQRRVLVDPEHLTESDFIFTSEDGERREPPELLKATGVRPAEPLVVHMLAHLRQGELAAGDGTTDGLLARAAWREGEANLLAVDYLFRSIGIADEVLRIGLDPGDVLGGALLPAGLAAPETIEDRLLDFIYREGFARAAEAHRAGGWPALERAMAERSTAWDILHPEAEPRARPAAIDVASPDGYREVDRDRLGAQPIIDLVAVGSGKDNLGLLAADDWVDDALVRLERPGEAADGITEWVIRFGGERGADDFAYGIRRVFGLRFPGVAPEEGAATRVWRAAGRVFRLARSGAEVRIRIAPAAVDAALEAGTQAAGG